MAGYVPVLLITANVGSIFEEPSVMLNIWTEEFLATIARLDPKFIALHCQEVGGKNYEQSMRHVEYFVRLLMSSEELRLFDKVRVFLDEDFSSAEHFTALGNFYFVHESLKDVLLWDFKESSFVPVIGKDVHSGNIEAVTTKEKSKFPQDFFPECKWSRKGFLRTRWSISGTVFDLINIHLFHDASNFVAMETFPSVYSKTRRRALEHTLDRFHNDQYVNVPYFLFGDFNFRTDTAGVIKKLTEDTQESKLPSKNNFSKLQFHNKEDNLILTLGKKEFSHCEHQNVFMENSAQWLREYDKELEDFEGRLSEFPINFIPSYPFEENIKEGSNYMQTRVPAWCDRVLLSPTAERLVRNAYASDEAEYGIIGPTTCMGDHKPVYLRISLQTDAGIVNCCHLANAPQYCFKVPDSYVDTLSLLPDCRSYICKPVFIDKSANLLHAVPVKHDPYTPDSMDSPSPRALVISDEVPDINLLIDDFNGEESYFDHNEPRVSSASKRINTAVSPALLKSKLELIVQSENRDSKKTCTEIRKSPSECDLPSLSMDDKETQFSIAVRKNRRHSDVSWQRSQLLTRAWLQGKGHQAYDYFRYDLKRKSFSSTESNEIIDDAVLPELVIPRIAIITASNFVSNESSVNLHDDRHSTYSETRLSTYSDNRTKTISGEASSLEKSDAVCSRSFEERGLDTNRDENQFINIQDKNLYISSARDNQIKENIDVMYLAEDHSIIKDGIKSSEIFSNPADFKIDEEKKSLGKGNDDDQYKTFAEEKNGNCGSDKSTLNEKKLESGERLTEIPLDGGNEKDDAEMKLRNIDDENKINNVENESDNKLLPSVIPKICESKRGDFNVINENVNTYCSNVALSNEGEVLKVENNCDVQLGSRNTTRSNSSQSHESNITLGLTRRVTEKYKNDIAKEKGECKKCCCVIS